MSPGADADSLKLWADTGCPSTTSDCTNRRQTPTLTGGGADGKRVACEYPLCCRGTLLVGGIVVTSEYLMDVSSFVTSSPHTQAARLTLTNFFHCHLKLSGHLVKGVAEAERAEPPLTNRLTLCLTSCFLSHFLLSGCSIFSWKSGGGIRWTTEAN